MAPQRNKKKPYKSPSTGQPCDAAQYVAELMCIRKSEKQNTGNLGYKFWNKSHKDSYQGQIVAAKRLMKEFGEKTVISFINSPKGKNIYSLGFFTPLDFVTEAIKKYKVIFDKEQDKIVEQQEDEKPIIIDKAPAKPFSGKRNMLSRIKSLEKKDGEENTNT
jgi:hypothetical protein